MNKLSESQDTEQDQSTKITFKKETLRQLTDGELRQVAGASNGCRPTSTFAAGGCLPN